MNNFETIQSALESANDQGEHVVGWSNVEESWVVYDPINGTPDEVIAHFYCVGNDMPPTPMTEDSSQFLLGKNKGV